MPQSRIARLLEAFAVAEADFILVGGVAAVVNGAPVNTFDVDLVHSREPANIARILPVLEALDAVFRMQPSRRLKPDASRLAGPGHLNLLTRLGPLDLLGTVGNGLGYEDLLPHSSPKNLGGDLTVRVLNLEKLIGLKEELGGEKDRVVLPILRRTLAERQLMAEAYRQQPDSASEADDWSNPEAFER